MEYNNSTEISDSETKLCSGCQQFYGSRATNFMCSRCFKNSQSNVANNMEESGTFVQKETTQKPCEKSNIETVEPKITQDVEMEPKSEQKIEEKKESESPAPKPKVSIPSTIFIRCFLIHQSLIQLFYRRIDASNVIKRQDC